MLIFVLENKDNVISIIELKKEEDDVKRLVKRNFDEISKDIFKSLESHKDISLSILPSLISTKVRFKTKNIAEKNHLNIPFENCLKRKWFQDEDGDFECFFEKNNMKKSAIFCSNCRNLVNVQLNSIKRFLKTVKRTKNKNLLSVFLFNQKCYNEFVKTNQSIVNGYLSK